MSNSVNVMSEYSLQRSNTDLYVCFIIRKIEKKIILKLLQLNKDINTYINTRMGNRVADLIYIKLSLTGLMPNGSLQLLTG